MRTELWGLRNTETQELVLTYWASSQKHKALFSTREKAEDACKHNPQYEPFRIEAEPAKHGRWVISREYNEIIEMEITKYTCSVCGEYRLTANGLSQATKYCPNCGAKMDGGADHERS